MGSDNIQTLAEVDRQFRRYRRAGFGSLFLAAAVALLWYLDAIGVLHWPAALPMLFAALTAWSIGVAWYCLRRSDRLAASTIRRLDRSAMQRLERLAMTYRESGSVEYVYLKARLDEEQARIDRNGGVMSLIYVAIDRLDQVERQFSAQVADQVAEEVAAVVAAGLRVYDTLGRLSETEYLVVLPSTNRRGARRVADRLCKTVQSYRHRCPGGGTVDFLLLALGLAAYPFNGENMENVAVAAQSAMEAARAEGGGEVGVSEQFIRTDEKGQMVVTEAPATEG